MRVHPVCRVNLVTVVDRSGSIVGDDAMNLTNWNATRDFLADFVASNQIIIDPDHVQIGAVSFGARYVCSRSQLDHDHVTDRNVDVTTC